MKNVRMFFVAMLMIAVTACAAFAAEPVGWIQVKGATDTTRLVVGKVLKAATGWQFKFNADHTYVYRPSSDVPWGNPRKYTISNKGLIIGDNGKYLPYVNKSGILVGYKHSNGKFIYWN